MPITNYSLTKEGKELAAEKAKQWPDEWQTIKKAVDLINSTKTQDYVRLAIAAKTHLLSQRSGKTLSSEELQSKTAEHGWNAFTPEQYQEALDFLERVGLSPK